jgi:hypothetical protein
LPGTSPPHRPKSTYAFGATASRRASSVERRRVDRRRQVERHVDDRRQAARRAARGAGGEVLEVRLALVAEVHVRVDPAREHVQPGRVDLLVGVEALGAVRRDRRRSSRSSRSRVRVWTTALIASS